MQKACFWPLSQFFVLRSAFCVHLLRFEVPMEREEVSRFVTFSIGPRIKGLNEECRMQKACFWPLSQFFVLRSAFCIHFLMITLSPCPTSRSASARPVAPLRLT